MSNELMQSNDVLFTFALVIYLAVSVDFIKFEVFPHKGNIFLTYS